ncbi:MAG: alpha/beta hydrolase [Gemmatimonadaceae bacterium]
MSKAVVWVLAIALLVAAAALGGRAYATRVMSSRAVSPKPLGTTTPSAVDLPFSRVPIETGDRTLLAWWVRAQADSGKTAPAVLFLHGNRSSISDYVALQKFLYRQGVSSLVFDYSGFGASGGTPSLRNAIDDASAVARVFADSAGPTTRKVAMGAAMGSTILLQAIDSVQSHVNGVVIEGVDASVKESAVRLGQLPKLLAPLVVEPGDNVAAASRVRVPLLAVHSYSDARVPITDAQRVVAAVPGQSSLVRHWRKGHSALLSSTKSCDWAPVLAFVRTGALPAAKLDTTDACKVEEAQRIAAQKIADSLKAVAARQAAQKAAAARASAAKASTKTTSAKTKSGSAKVPTKSAGTKRPGTPTKRPE